VIVKPFEIHALPALPEFRSGWEKSVQPPASSRHTFKRPGGDWPPGTSLNPRPIFWITNAAVSHYLPFILLHITPDNAILALPVLIASDTPKIRTYLFNSIPARHDVTQSHYPSSDIIPAHLHVRRSLLHGVEILSPCPSNPIFAELPPSILKA
jgi:hypothetical protein